MLTVDEARENLRRIEDDLDTGSYRPGPWKALVAELRKTPADTRRALVADINRVSDKLHGRGTSRTLPILAGLSVEIGASALALLGLERALDLGWPLAVLAAAGVLTMTLQPLVKVTAGAILGVRYSYFYLWGPEPRVKMRYGTFLAAATWRRVVVHLAGTIGSPLALAFCANASSPHHPKTALFLFAAFTLLVLIQVVMLLGGIAGARRIGPSPPVALSSAGAAGLEIRAALGRAG